MKIEEIKIMRIEDLSPQAQTEVNIKLKSIRSKNPDFKFVGFTEVLYGENSPKFAILSVNPIEGTIVDYFRMLTASFPKKK